MSTSKNPTYRDIHQFALHFPDLNQAPHVRRIQVLGYYLQASGPKPSFNAKDIQSAYEQLDLAQAGNFRDLISKMKERNILVRFQDGYRLSKASFESISAELGNPTLVSLSAELEKLPELLKSPKVDFMREALDCLRVKAWRAAIVMMWILTIDHLYDFVLATNLSNFNAALAKNLRYASLSIRNKQDLEEIKESDFIQIARSAGLLTNDQRKLLDEKLAFRNSCAHPSTIVVTESKVTSYLEDLAYNIIVPLKVP
ncbi:MAG TPA: hypothetical protein VGR53_02340 [Nitrososphaerales archaeon]|nr:hypothetical protein [Nitrososphaerales archaeon]